MLAIVALSLGAWRGWTLLDPAMGIVGGAIVLKWGLGLIRSAGRAICSTPPRPRVLEQGVKGLLETLDDVRVADIHTWQIGPGRLACIVSLVTESPRETAHYRRAGAGPLRRSLTSASRCTGPCETLDLGPTRTAYIRSSEDCCARSSIG